MEKQVAYQRDQLRSAHDKADAAERNVLTWKRQCDDLREQLSAMKELQAQVAATSDLAVTIADLQQQLGDMQGDLQASAAQVEQRDATIVALRGEVRAKDDAIGSDHAQLSLASQTIAQLNERLEEQAVVLQTAVAAAEATRYAAAAAAAAVHAAAVKLCVAL
jgi:chromosome segregation ATPase